MPPPSRLCTAFLLLASTVVFPQDPRGHSISRSGTEPGTDSATPPPPSIVAVNPIAVPPELPAYDTNQVRLSMEAGSPAARSPLPADTSTYTHRSGPHFRVGLHASSKDIGLLLGGSIRSDRLSCGFDGWIRPGTYVQNVQITPTRRAQYKELLWGFDPWVQWEFGSQTRLALFASLDIGAGMYYGTTKSPPTEFLPALGAKILLSAPLQIGIRRTFKDGLLGAWRGELAWEF